MAKLAAIFVLMGLLLPACDGADEAQPDSWIGRDRMTHVHPAGLEIELPEGVYDVEQTATGWRIRPRDAAQTRHPPDITIAIAAPARPVGQWPQSRQLRGRTFRYRIDSESGGSGGDLHVLRAWEEGPGDTHLLLEETVQVEAPAQPDFADGWAILSLARRR